MNVRDSEVIAGLLTAKGYELVDSPDEADAIIFNTCCVRQHAEDKVWSEIGRYKAPLDLLCKSRQGDTRPMRKIIGLVGCMAEYHKHDAFKKAPDIDFVCGPNDIGAIPFLVAQALDSRSKGIAVGLRQRDEFVYKTDFQLDKDHCFVNISEGCNNLCSYCVVPMVRGRERNRHYEDILTEIERLVQKGIKKITLLGQNVNSYQSENITFSRLLVMVNEIEGLESFEFVTSHPKDASWELFVTMAKLNKLQKHLHLPLQSGSNRILKLMNRKYSLKDYLKRVAAYRKIVGGTLSTDIIVGFPTETEKDFELTKRVLEKVRFDSAYIFKYSLRPRTHAAQLSDDVPLKEKERRHGILLDLQKEISKEKK
ncbi:MAG: tRNA (N6-isopentenyl adenosine(37)-C2)-methylthiotransferase MiaB [Candidatus Omnitrophota bacterium]